MWVYWSTQSSDVIIASIVIVVTMGTMMHGVFSSPLVGSIGTALVLVATAPVQRDRPTTATIVTGRIVIAITVCHFSMRTRMRLVTIGLHLPTTVSFAVRSVSIINVALLRRIVLFIRRPCIRLVSIPTFPEIPTVSMVPRIPSITTTIMYWRGFMRGPSIAMAVSVTTIAYTHITFGHMMLMLTIVVALGHKVTVALTVYFIRMVRTCIIVIMRSSSGRVVHRADRVIVA